MTATRLRPALILLIVAFAICALASYDVAVATDTPGSPADSMQGTYLVIYGTGTNDMKAIVNPSVVTIGGRQFMAGNVSGKVEDILKDNVFSGSSAYVALDSIITMQEIKERQE
jgi:hypothetical protein